MKRWVVGCISVVIAVACGSGTGPSARPSGHAVAVVSGDHQLVPVRTAAGAPLVVRITDTHGEPVAGALVAWQVTSGRGAISGATASDTNGVSQASFAADSIAGPVRVQAGGAPASDSVVFAVGVVAGAPARIARASGDGQFGCFGTVLPTQLGVIATDQYGNIVSGPWVHWTIAAGGGHLSVDSSRVDIGGHTSASFTLGTAGPQSVSATSTLSGSPIIFTATGRRCFSVLGGGNNEGGRYTSDLWLARGYAYTGTWEFRSQVGNVVDVWQLGPNGAPTQIRQLTVAANIQVVSDLQVSPDSTLLAVTGEYGSDAGLYLYSLADPSDPAFLARWLVTGSQTSGLHTGTLAVVDGQLYDFTARDPRGPALLIFRIQPDSTDKIALVDSLSMPANYGIHDTYVRDGMLFVENWNSGLWIYDIGGAGRGGTVASPVFISSIVTGAAADGSTPAGQVHNAWWFHNPATGEQKYVFVGQEGPDVIGSQSNGDIHVVDISDLDHPTEVAHYHMGSHQGTHNFWMDESRQILYAAYYNGGVVALDVSGTLSGDLAGREIARLAPGGAGDTYVWGVMLYGGHLYAADMLSGLWALAVP
ncbi:MAG: Ig-like domain-containing protein [Gemmatimonadales bacterium]